MSSPQLGPGMRREEGDIFLTDTHKIWDSNPTVWAEVPTASNEKERAEGPVVRGMKERYVGAEWVNR